MNPNEEQNQTSQTPETQLQQNTIASTPVQTITPAPQAANQTIQYSSRLDRFVAYIMDGFIILIFALGIWLPGLITGSIISVGISDDIGSVITYSSGTFSIILAWWLVRIRPVVKYGYTLGKKPLHLKILKEDTTPLPRGSVWVRELALFISGFFRLDWILVLPILFTKKRQGLHDMMVKSIVVKDPLFSNQNGGKSKNVLLFALLAIPAVIIILGILAALVVTTFSGIQQRAREAAQNQDANLSIKLVERNASSGSNTVSVLVPSNWKNLAVSDTDNEKNYIDKGEFNDNLTKRVSFKIHAEDKFSTSGLNDEYFQQFKTNIATSSEATAMARLESLGFTNCVLSPSEQPGLEGRSFGYRFTHTCEGKDFSDDPKKVEVEGLSLFIYTSDGVTIELYIDNPEPNKLKQETIDKIINSLKFN